jgi:MFS family permease
MSILRENELEEEFPWISMTALCIGMLAHSIVFTSPMPYVAFMVVDFKVTGSLDSAGYWAGWITGMFMIGRVVAGERNRCVCVSSKQFNVVVNE